MKNSVICEICKKDFKIITCSHLKYVHNMTVKEYRQVFPNSELYSEEMRELFSKNTSGENNPSYGREQSEETRKKRSLSQKGKPKHEGFGELVSRSSKGKLKSESHRKNLSLSKKGKHYENSGKFKKGMITWNLNLTKETDERVAMISRKESETQKLKFQNIDYKNDWIENTLPKILKSAGTHPNRMERKLDNTLQINFPGEWKYVGDGSVILFHKSIDYINVNGQKSIIELFGEHWHKPEEEQERIEYFKQFGYKTLVIWQKELKDEPAVIAKICTFMEESKC